MTEIVSNVKTGERMELIDLIGLNDNKAKWDQWSSSPNIKSEQKRAEQGA